MNYNHIVLQGYLECKPEKTAFGKYFERQAKIAERDEFVEEQDFYGECQSVIKSYQDEVYYQYRKYLTEHDSALAGYRTALKNGRTIDDKGVAIQTHIDNILQERKGKEQQGYENDTYYFWCGTDGDGKIVNDMFSLEHKLYYPILERMRLAIQELENRNQVDYRKSELSTGINFKKKNQTEVKSFEDYIHHKDKPKLMNKLHELIDNTKAKNVAIVISALKECSFLSGYNSQNSLYRSMRAEFNFSGNNSGLCKLNCVRFYFYS